MHKKLITRTLAASWMAVGLLYAGNSSASTIACNDGSLGADITDKVNPNEGCLILEPLDANDNDSVSPPADTFTVNQETFFGHDDWLFDGKYDELPDSPVDNSDLFDFTGDAESGNFSYVGDTPFSDFFSDIMFVFKDGNDTNLVGYLIDMDSLLDPGDFNNLGNYASPFVEPPFDFSGEGPRNISHISVYYREAEDGNGGGPGGIPEPAPLALLAAGLIGMGWMRRGKSQ
ncbi:MAG: PEP-CTERM sorting domain-containing protein [Methylohalobius sp. ZOD2]